jgi:hypothetical protein
MKWLRRRRGTEKQIGKAFPIGGKRKKLPKVVYPIKCDKKKAVNSKRVFYRFFGKVTRSVYEKLKDNVVPESDAHFLLNESTILAGRLPENKKSWRGLIKKAVKAEKPLAYAIITPIWISRISPQTKGVLPSRHPFRKEGVIITAYSPREQKASFVEYEFITPKLIEVKKPVVWEKFEDSLVGNVYGER